MILNEKSPKNVAIERKKLTGLLFFYFYFFVSPITNNYEYNIVYDI